MSFINKKEILTIFEFNKKITETAEKALYECKEKFEEIEKIHCFNQKKVLKAFIDSKVSESHFISTTGYGYNDRGREKLGEVYSCIFKTEDALVSDKMVSGTHALSTALFGILRPFDKILSVTGMPYDTLMDVIDSKSSNLGSLSDFKIKFDYVEYNNTEEQYFKIIKNKLTPDVKVVYIQRSRGYTLRNSLSCEEIGKICNFVKSVFPQIIVMVDNCYGEFAEIYEPSEFGADLIVGSLIKNPGGGIAPTGGYIAGGKNLVNLCAHRLTAPGIGKEVGSNAYGYRDFFMGIYNSPKIVGEALKTAVFTARLFELLGFEVYPKSYEKRFDIVQSVLLRSPELLINFCKGIQSLSPIDSFVSPEPWEMPGYESQVIMAAGTFISGSSIELSADAPLREPYAVWVQGATDFYAAQAGIMKAAQNVIEKIRL